MTIYICGAGPTGLSLAWLLRNQGEQIVILEKYKKSGGTWATRWDKNGFFTQHSPQILSTSYLNTINILKEMDIDFNASTQFYNTKWFDVIFYSSTILDKWYLIKTFLQNMFRPELYKKITIQEHFHSKLSSLCWKVIYHLCYLIDGVSPSVMTVAEMYNIFDYTNFYTALEMNVPSEDSFIGEWTRKLREFEHINFEFNTEITNIFTDNNNRLNLKLYHTEEDTQTTIKLEENDKLLLALDPLSLTKLLRKSSSEIQNNWGNYENLKQILYTGTYTSLSVQYHFLDNIELELPYKVQMGLETEWGIICTIIPFNNVISCSVINLDTYSSYLNETVLTSSPEQVKQEVWRQLSEKVKLPNFSHVTLGTDVKYNNMTGWDFESSSACRTTLGPISSHGQRNDIAIVGPINKRNYPAATMESAVESALLYVGKKTISPWKVTGVIKFFLTMILCIFCATRIF